MEFELALAIADTAVVDTAGRHLNDVETAILRGSWQGQTYEQIADASGYSVSYLTRDIGPKLWRLLSQALGEPVSKTSFRVALERRGQEIAASAPEHAAADLNLDDQAGQHPSWLPPDRTLPPYTAAADVTVAPRVDWGEAPDVSIFFGREEELATLTQWLQRDRCRLVLLLGMGGIGKTSLAARLAQELVGEQGVGKSEKCAVLIHPSTHPPIHPLPLHPRHLAIAAQCPPARRPAARSGDLSLRSAGQ